MALSQSDVANLVSSIKQGNPNATDADLSNVLKLVTAASDAPEDHDAASAAADAVSSLTSAGKASTVPLATQNTPTSTVAPQDVTQALPASYVAPTAPLNPYAGTGTSAADILKKQFGLADQANATVQASPTMADQAAAEQRYQASIAANAPGRTAANFMAATGGPLVSAESSKQWDALNAANKDLTIGAANRAQEFAKGAIANQQSAINAYQTGVTTAGTVLDQMDKSGRFQIDANKAALEQKKLQLELVGSAAQAGVTQKLMDANSDLSKAARNSAIVMLKQTGLYSDAQIAKMVPPTMTGIEAAPIAKMSGDNLEALLKKGQTAQANGAAAASYAAAGLSAATAQKEKVTTAGIIQGQTFDANAGMPKADYAAVGAAGPAAAQYAQTVAPSNAVAQTAIARQGGTPTGPTTAQLPQPVAGQGGAATLGGYQMQPTRDASGQTTWQPSTYIQQAGRESATTLADTTRSISNYKLNGGKDAAQEAFKQAPSMGGVLGAGGRNIVNYTNSAATKEYQLKIDRLNQEAAEVGLIAGKGSGTGLGAAIGATGAQLARQGGPSAIAGTALAAGGHLFNGGQPVSSTTDPKVIQQLAIEVQEARAKQEAMIPYLNQFQKSHGGSLAEAVAPEYITKAQTMINPATGDVSIEYTPKDAKIKLDQGWVRKEDFLKGNK